MSIAEENMERLVLAREQFDAILTLQPILLKRDALAIAALGRTLGVSETALTIGLRLPRPEAAGYEPPKVQLVGNMHTLLAHVCPPKEIDAE